KQPVAVAIALVKTSRPVKKLRALGVWLFVSLLIRKIQRATDAGSGGEMPQEIHFTEYVAYCMPRFIPVVSLPFKVRSDVALRAQIRPDTRSPIISGNIKYRNRRYQQPVHRDGAELTSKEVIPQRSRVTPVIYIQVLSNSKTVSERKRGVDAGGIPLEPVHQQGSFLIEVFQGQEVIGIGGTSTGGEVMALLRSRAKDFIPPDRTFLIHLLNEVVVLLVERIEVIEGGIDGRMSRLDGAHLARSIVAVSIVWHPIGKQGMT